MVESYFWNYFSEDLCYPDIYYHEGCDDLMMIILLI